MAVLGVQLLCRLDRLPWLASSLPSRATMAVLKVQAPCRLGRLPCLASPLPSMATLTVLGVQSLCRLDRLPCLASDDDVGSPDYFDGSPSDPVCRSLSFGVRTRRFIGVVASYPVLFSGSPCTSEVDLVGSPVFKHQFDKFVFISYAAIFQGVGVPFGWVAQL